MANQSPLPLHTDRKVKHADRKAKHADCEVCHRECIAKSNREYSKDLHDQDCPLTVKFLPVPDTDQAERVNLSENARQQDRVLYAPIHTQYRNVTTRLASFGSPKSREISIEMQKRAVNGFFFDGNVFGDIVCFYCDFTLRGEFLSEPDCDVEWEHARWSPYCAYLRDSKGENFVHTVMRMRSISNPSHKQERKI